MTEECVIFQSCGLGERQRVLPVSSSTRGQQGIVTAGSQDDGLAVDERALAGIPRRNGRSKFPDQIQPQRNSPVAASRQRTWHFGSIATTYLSATAGMVRVIP
jgi:hypothetical protein